MRTIVVGDMHQKQRLILPIVDGAARLLGAKRVVLLVFVNLWLVGSSTVMFRI